MTNDPLIVPKWVWVGLVVLALLGLGLFVSPRDQQNRPILLLPDAKAVEDYRNSISGWHERMQTLDSEITTILSGKFGSDLFSKSREAQKVMDSTIQLAQEIDRQDVPTAAIPAKSLLAQSASAYLNASRAMLQWVTASNEENLVEAQNTLEQARQTLKQLEQSEWINP
jgi:hypothetical protein